MKLKITIPEDISDISLSEFQKYEVLNEKLKSKEYTAVEYNKRKIELFSGLPYHRIDSVPFEELESILSDIDKALDKDCKFVDRFFIGGVEFGFIPNFDKGKVSAGEFIDMQEYGVKAETLHRLMAVLFRPIRKKHKEKYKIIKYSGTEKHAEVMRIMPMHIVNGALVFFYSLSRELQKHTLKSTIRELAKEQRLQTTSVSGVGMLPSTN